MTELLVAKTQEYRVMRRSYTKKGESGLVNTLHHLNFLSLNDLLGSGTADGLHLKTMTFQPHRDRKAKCISVGVLPHILDFLFISH